MNEIFDQNSTAQIDAKLHRDIIEHENKVITGCVIALFVLMYIFRGWISYNIKFGIAFPSGLNSTRIEVAKDPTQTNYSEEEKARKTFTYKTLTTGKKVKLIPQAHYKLSGLTVGYNSSTLFKYDTLNDIALYDLGTAWGKLGDKYFYNKNFKNYQVSNYRVLWTVRRYYNSPVSEEYARTHYAHSYIIPATRNIMAALLNIKMWDKVELEGELVDVEQISNETPYTDRTSLTTADDGWQGDRGSGSSEIIYLTKIKIGNIIYK